MGALINLVEEVRLRLKAGIDANAIACSHNNVYVGSRLAFMKMNDYPRVGIILPSGDGSPECMRYGTTEDSNLEIGYIIAKLQDDYNVLYKASDSSGPLRNLEQIINYININRSTSAIDPQLNGNAYDAIKYRWSIREDENELLYFTIYIDVKSAKYTKGAL